MKTTMEPGSDMVPISDHYCGWKKSIPKWVVYDIVLPTCVHINPSYPLVKRLHNYGKYPPCLMGKSTMSMAIFNSYVKLPEGKLCSCFGIK